MGVPDGEDVVLGADADLDVGVAIDPTRTPDPFFAFGRDICSPRIINLEPALVFDLLVEVGRVDKSQGF